MPIRKIKPEEKIMASKIFSIGFAWQLDLNSAEKNPEESQKGYEFVRAFFNEQGKMCSFLNSIPYEMRFSGHTVKMGGIGGVSSLPEERKNGNIRSLFYYSLEEMYKNDFAFSFLYPFSNTYYRQFGYESCYKRLYATIPLESFKAFPKTGNVKHYLPNQDSKSVEAIKGVYDQFIQDKNLSIVRNDFLWKGLIDVEPYKTRQYTYIWYDDKGIPKSYIIFEAVGDGTYDMEVKELIWLDYESLIGILGFLQNFSPLYKNFKCSFPEYLNLHIIFPEPIAIKSEILVSGMNRIVNMEKTLKLMDYPKEEGSLAILVDDPFLKWNCGTFLVTWDSNGVEVVKKDCPPDLSCSIQVITQLVTGYTSIEDYMGREDVKVFNNADTLAAVFNKKHLFINDFF